MEPRRLAGVLTALIVSVGLVQPLWAQALAPSPSAQQGALPAAPGPVPGVQRLDISVRTDKGIYRPGDRPRISGHAVFGGGSQGTGFARILISELEADRSITRYDNIVDVKNGDFSDDGFVIQMPRRHAIEWSTVHIRYRVQAVGLTNQLLGDVASTEFMAEEVGILQTFAIVMPVLVALGYVLGMVYYAFMKAPTKRAATVMLLMTYLSALVFMAIPFLGTLLIFLSSDLETFMRTTPVGFLKASITRPDEPQWVFNIGGVLTAGPPGGPGVLKGGIAIPLLVIALATLGAAINMLRKLPDFLEKYDAIPVLPDGAESLAGEQLRADLFRYFVYTLSAPFVGMIAYSLMFLADYTNPHALSIVAFSVGFISDTVIESIMGKARSMLGGKDGSSGPKPKPAEDAGQRKAGGGVDKGRAPGNGNPTASESNADREGVPGAMSEESRSG